MDRPAPCHSDGHRLHGANANQEPLRQCRTWSSGMDAGIRCRSMDRRDRDGSRAGHRFRGLSRSAPILNAVAANSSGSGSMSAKQSKADFFGSVPGFPISLAVRAGDYAYTATLGSHTFEAEKVVYDSGGRVVSDGSGRGNAGIEEQTRATMRN